MVAKKKSTKPVDPRVEVASDVIELLRTKRIVAASMMYFHARLRRARRKPPGSLFYKEVDVQKLMAGANVERCDVCAKGALMVAFATKHDQAKADVSDDVPNVVIATESMCSAPLLGTFSQAQLDEIERAYEGFSYSRDWLMKYPNNDARLCAIMRRIIDNGGEFRASEEP